MTVAKTSYNYKRLAIRKKRRCRKCFPVLDRKIRIEFSKEPKLLPDSQLEEAWDEIDQQISKELGLKVVPKKEEEEGGEDGYDCSDLDEDGEEEEDDDLLRKCRCRQGRSAESRKKIEQQQRELSWDPNRIGEVCPDPNCGGRDLVMDHRENQAICTACGAIQEDIVPCGEFDRSLLKSRSKPYTTPVYANEKLRALNKSDPEIWLDEWELITVFAILLFGLNFKSELERTMGPRTFGRICKSVKNDDGVAILANKKYGERWIQV